MNAFKINKTNILITILLIIGVFFSILSAMGCGLASDNSLLCVSFGIPAFILGIPVLSVIENSPFYLEIFGLISNIIYLYIVSCFISSIIKRDWKSTKKTFILIVLIWIIISIFFGIKIIQEKNKTNSIIKARAINTKEECISSGFVWKETVWKETVWKETGCPPGMDKCFLPPQLKVQGTCGYNDRTR